MKRIIIFAMAVIMAIPTVSAQSRKVVREAKSDAKYEIKGLKDKGYKAMDNVKLDDEVVSFLTEKYSNKSCVEVVGKATGLKDINEAKGQARQNAIGAVPDEDVIKTIFVYHKKGSKYDVLCYALVGGASAPAAASNSRSLKKTDGMDAYIAAAKADEAQKEAKAQEKKDKAKAKAKAKKEANKAEKNAKKEAQKAYDKAYDKAMNR